MPSKMILFVLFTIVIFAATDSREMLSILSRFMPSVESKRRLEDISTEEERAIAGASGAGAHFSRAIKDIRGGTDTFYRDLITAGKIALCEHGLEKNSIRFVNSTDDDAYKDSEGDCVRLTGSPLQDEAVIEAYTQGACEVMPNCYWAAINQGDTRRAQVYGDSRSLMNKEMASSTIKNWLVGVISFVVPGLLLGVASLFATVFFLLYRCCCSRCCIRQTRKAGYTRAQKCCPVLLFLVSSIGVFIISTAALLYRNSILGSVDEIFSATSGLLGNGSDWVVSIRDPLENIRDEVNSSVDHVIKELDGSDFVEAGVYGLIAKLRAFGVNAANRTLPGGCLVHTDQSKEKYIGNNGNICLPCDVCTMISLRIDTASDEVEKKAEPGVQQLIKVRSQLNHKLVSIADSVRDAVDSKALLADNLISTLETTRGKVDHYDDIFQKYRYDLGLEIMTLFYFSTGVILIGAAGILFGLVRVKLLAYLMHLAYFSGFLVLILVFIVSAVIFALGIVLGDSCEVALIFSTNWTVPLGTSARAVDACFQNESLLNVFDLSSQLSFARGGISFPTINVSSMLDFSALDNFSATFSNSKDAAFNFSGVYFDEVVDFVNSYATQDAKYCKLNDIYTKENALQPWDDNGELSTNSPVEYIIERYENDNSVCAGLPNSDYGHPFVCTNHSNPCAFSEFMGEQFRVLVNIATINNSVFDFAAHLQRNVTDVVEFTHEFKSNITNLLGRVERIKDHLQSSLIRYVDDFEKAMYCNFIADGFFSIYDVICVKMAPSITMIGFMLLTTGILLIPPVVALIISSKRLKARSFSTVVVGMEHSELDMKKVTFGDVQNKVQVGPSKTVVKEVWGCQSDNEKDDVVGDVER
ncbi:hypothetical protein P3T76_001814 [Phytophthora citrophthora]|uniref:Uncharacterized protein n=1 Tax=Phytophthora citrophthora TaxID=4793 RepID=A0AAD9GY73_9STRA|nr:hypothetical protein P3T76_001814 [Phytophthora citrophthora]